MELVMSVGKRVREARKKAGLSQQDLADAIGIKQPTLSELERGISTSSTHLISIANACGVSPDWLQTGNTTKSYSELSDAKAQYTVGKIDPWDSKTPLSEDEVELPFYKEVELKAGTGSVVAKEDSGFKLRFSRSTLRRFSIQPELAACVVVSGDSMQPVIPDQATIGIDTGNTRIKDGDMYAIDHGGLLRVKILYRLPNGGIRLRSFNRDDYPDEDLNAEDAVHIRVLGRVFWYSVLR